MKPIWILGLSAFCSGSAALIYETLWARSFSLIFGSTVQANAAVFAGFIVGLAIGAAVYGRWTRKSADPVRLYGLVEFGIAVSAILVGIVLFQFRNTWIVGGGGKGFLFIMQTVGLVVLLILVPAGLMGGTLPILLHLARKLVDDAAVVGRIYSFNVLGAAFGALLCGFYTIPKLGIIQSHFAAGTLNVIAGVLVLGLKLNLDRSNKAAQKKVMTKEPSVATVTQPEWFLVLAVFISGFAVYSVEILWSRLAQYFIGNRIFAFSILLSSVLCLLAIGSMVSSYLIRKYRDQLADSMGFLVLASALGLLLSSWGSHQLIFHQEQWETGFPGMGKGLLVYRFLETFVVLGPSLITLGVLFPVCLVLSKRSDQDIAASTGRFYVLNAVGSVFGSLATGFFLLKIFGVYRSMLLLICLLVAAADVFFVYSYLKSRKPQALYGIGAGMLVILMGLMALPSQLILLKDGDKLVHRLEDEYGIFQVAQLPEPRSGLKRVTNNRTELVFYYGSKNTRRVQGMQAHLGMLYNPGAVNAAVLGSGYGITAGELSLYPQLKRIDAVEILPGMIEAADLFSLHNRDYHKKATVRVIQDDGRHYLVASDLNYDLIIINITDPHTPGSGSLYHADFLEIIKNRLNPNGVVVLHPFGEDRGLQLRTIANVFPYWLAFKAYSNGYNLIASADPLQYDAERVKVMVASNPEIGKSLKRFNYVETKGESRLDFE
ncbi:MAG TPA: hypothetical protein EYQ50_02310 [Verrucomicrobiales bacterium]|nr:hypothetical protein [Verrucomicrobiales bacterium]